MNTAKLFRNGHSQAVRLPKEFQFQGGEVVIRRVGRAVILLPQGAPPYASLLASLDAFTPDFMDERDQGGQQEREAL